jgi:outer membrane beta-barrel protein
MQLASVARAAECDQATAEDAGEVAAAPADAPAVAPPSQGPPSDAAGPSDPAAAPATPAAAVAPAGNDGAPSSAAEALGRTPRRVKCLDESMVDQFGRTAVRKGVQPRDFRKARRLALGITGGVRGGDLTDTQWTVGGNLAFWPFEDVGLDVDFDLSPMTLRLERAATGFTGNDRFPNGVVANFSYAILGHILYAPFHTKLRARGDRIIHGDFVLIGGGGAVLHDSVQAAAFDVGAGFYLFPAKFVSLRVDLVDRIMAQEALGSRRIANDLVFSAGVAFWIPPRRRGDR